MNILQKMQINLLYVDYGFCFINYFYILTFLFIFGCGLECMMMAFLLIPICKHDVETCSVVSLFLWKTGGPSHGSPVSGSDISISTFDILSIILACFVLPGRQYLGK